MTHETTSLLTEKIERPKAIFWTIGRRRYVIAWLFMLPTLLVLAVFTFYPLVMGIILAFFENNLLGEPRFVGLDNFSRALGDQDFMLALWHSALYLLVVPLMQITSLGLAMLVNRKLKG